MSTPHYSLSLPEGVEAIMCQASELTDADFDELAALSREAFAEHAKNGLNMYPCSVQGERLKRIATDDAVCQNNTFFIISKDGKRVAFRLACTRTDEKGGRFGYFKLIAVLPCARGLRLGKLLFHMAVEYGEKLGCGYLETDTSIFAKSSYGFHTACGFKPWRYTHFRTSNYYSIILRYDLKEKLSTWQRRLALWRTGIGVRMRYQCYTGKERLFYRAADFVRRGLRKVVRMVFRRG